MAETYEQLEIMKVIQFPKNKEYESRKRDEKLSAAIKMLEYFVSEGKEFNIVVDKETALTLFEESTSNQKIQDYVVLTTSDRENSQKFKVNINNSNLYFIQGTEFD